jgi:hypothetical protein
MHLKSMVAQALLLITFSLMEIGTAFGCSMAGGHDYVINLSAARKCHFLLDPRNILQGENLRDFIRKNDLISKSSGGTANYCEKFDPTAVEEQALQAAISRYNNDFTLGNGGITIERLSLEAHRKLLDEAQTINSDECNCKKIAFVERIGDLTARFDHKNVCKTDAMCQSIPPKGCISRYYYDYAKFRDYAKFHYRNFSTVTRLKTFGIALLVIGLSMLTTLAALIGVIFRRMFQKIPGT